ncbi:ABC transporter permease [Pseudonocardia kongjuensis]|uniref:ABC transporter permease n=1 Tax=Pseudonocardia kongjuensis TaxID=102227 RepID=UPI0031E3C1EB
MVVRGSTVVARLPGVGRIGSVPRAWWALWPLAALLGVIATARLVVPYDPERVVAPANLPPGAGHLFGTDSTGMDVFSRTVAAAQVNLTMALLVTVFATAGGLVVGIAVGTNEARAGAFGLLGRGVTRGIDLADSVPPLVVGVVIVGLFGATMTSLSAALALILLPNQARLTRAEVLRVRGEAFVDAALMAGLRPWRVTVRHVLPNSARPAIENSSNVFGVSIVVLASLGFLGIGLNPPTPEWGYMISTGVSDVMLGGWWTTLFPALALCLAVITAASLSGALTRLSRGPAAR